MVENTNIPYLLARVYIETFRPDDLKLRPIVAGSESLTQRISHFIGLMSFNSEFYQKWYGIFYFLHEYSPWPQSYSGTE